MSEARSKGEKAPPMLPSPKARPQIPASLGPKLPAALARLTGPARERANAAHKFDKAFPVFLESIHGVSNGVGRNISPEGMFVETRDPLPMGSQVRVIFGSREMGAEITAVAEVRFQCFLNYAGADGEQEGMRGMGVRFLRFEEGEATPGSRATAQ
jgi:hypothetical protein